MSRLDQRLAAAGVPPGSEPFAAWWRLLAVEGRTVTLLDLYELAARDRGVAAHEMPVGVRRELTELAMPAIWPGWTLAGDSARRPEPIELVAYDPEWPAQYADWAQRLRDALGPAAVRIEHVGSTSIPGLAAKPIIDIQVSVADIEDEASYAPALERVGLQLRSRDELHRFFRPPPDQPRVVHVHVCPADSEWGAEHRLFRDWLRTHASARRAYLNAKRSAAERWADDRMAYTEAKTAIVLRLLDDARRG